MKTPISYYGGKQTMLKHILPLIPKHTIYTEAFCGGCAVMFAKPPAPAEIINDINGELINFYCVAKAYSDLLLGDTSHRADNISVQEREQSQETTGVDGLQLHPSPNRTGAVLENRKVPVI